MTVRFSSAGHNQYPALYTYTLPTQAQGDTVIVLINIDVGFTITAITDTNNNTYNPISAWTGTNTAQPRLFFGYVASNVPAANSGDNTITITCTSTGYILWDVFIITGNPGAVDGSGADLNPTSSPEAAVLTTTNADDYLFGVINGWGGLGNPITMGANFTLEADDTYNFYCGDRTATSAGTYTFAPTSGTSPPHTPAFVLALGAADPAVQSKFGSITGSQSISIAFDSDNTAGNTIVVCAAGRYGGVSSTSHPFADTANGTYPVATVIQDNSDQPQFVCIGVLTGIAAGPNTVTFTNDSFGNGDQFMGIYEFPPSSGVRTFGSDASPTTAEMEVTITGVVAGDIVVACQVSNNGNVSPWSPTIAGGTAYEMPGDYHSFFGIFDGIGSTGSNLIDSGGSGYTWAIAAIALIPSGAPTSTSNVILDSMNF